MANSVFTFKQFKIEQSGCAMKVGTDGVLLGAWARGGERILDVGTGSGLIALMMAQRCPSAQIVALDIDEGLKPYVNDYKINLFEIAYLDREIIDSFKSDFWILADYLYQMRVNKNYIADKKSIGHIEELLMLMSAMTGDKRFEEIIDEANTKEVVNMCEVLDIVEARGIEKGIEKGREEGADIISRLNTILAKEGDLDKIIKANTDKKYRNELLKKYNLLRDYEK